MEKKIDKSAPGGIKIHFPGAKLAPSSDRFGRLPRFHIGWYLQGSDINSACLRYRCFHFARSLDQEFESSFFSGYPDLKNAIGDLDAVIIGNRLDHSTIDLAALARHLGKPLFLDLCEDLANPGYPSGEEPYLALSSLLALAPALSGITVSSAEMAERVGGYLADNGLTRPLCHVIPDIAETRELFAATERFVRSRGAGRVSVRNGGLADVSRPSSSPRRIIWFGNFGGPHSNSGMFSLKSRFKSLRDFHRHCPIELVIVSNNAAVYDRLVAGCGFPTRYAPWSPSAVYDELDQADVALLTNGNDDFSAVKSSNRVAQALAASVPVITDKSPALAEFEEVIFAGKFEHSLEACLGPDRETNVSARLALAAPILQRYAPERLAGHWSDLLKRSIGRALAQREAKSRNGIWVLLDAGDDPDHALAAILTINRTVGRDCDLLVSTELMKDKAFGRTIHRAKALPMFFSGALANIEGQIARRSAVVLGNPESANGKRASEIALRLGMEVLTHAGAAEAELERFTAQHGRASAGSRTPPGPYPQRTEPDGSVEWAFVVNRKANGWILDAICQEIGSRQPSSWVVVDEANPPPLTRNLFFSHFSLLNHFDNRYPEALTASNVFVWYTHPRDETPSSIARNLELFNRTTRIIFTCESNRRLWIERGLDPDKAAVVLGAADPVLFRRHARDGGGAVGLSSSFYERKNPELMLNVVKALPHRNFVLLGRHWNRYARFEELLALPNFSYLSRPYRDYPRIYSTFDVFLSISSLEGGPIPLVEAMMCNAVPVASRTGFAPDLIAHGRNGFMFDTDGGPDRVSDLIEQAFALDADVRETVEQYSWDRFSAEIVGLAP